VLLLLLHFFGVALFNAEYRLFVGLLRFFVGLLRFFDGV
jgi:hypothetical protein